ncbi:hypothetical protein GGH96_000744 [Coemansia sp. RSA 1972]|nr:hypothetical protein GGH96_000744 [Coemansia sp. RSA 1972]
MQHPRTGLSRGLKYPQHEFVSWNPRRTPEGQICRQLYAYIECTSKVRTHIHIPMHVETNMFKMMENAYAMRCGLREIGESDPYMPIKAVVTVYVPAVMSVARMFGVMMTARRDVLEVRAK